MRIVIRKRETEYLKILPSEVASLSLSLQVWSVLFVASLQRWTGQSQCMQVLAEQEITVSCGVSVLGPEPSRLASMLCCDSH